MKHVLAALLEGSLNELGLGALPGFLSDPWGSFRDELLEPFTDWAQDLIDNVGASVYQEALERVRDLSDAVEMTQEVFQDIGEAVRDALDSGETPPQTDGGLGQVHDNYTPDGDVLINGVARARHPAEILRPRLSASPVATRPQSSRWTPGRRSRISVWIPIAEGSSSINPAKGRQWFIILTGPRRLTRGHSHDGFYPD